jgi:hypothetical protein
MRKGTEAATWTTLCLVTQTLAKKVWVVEKLSGTVAEATTIAIGALALVVKLLVARFSCVQGCTTF